MTKEEAAALQPGIYLLDIIRGSSTIIERGIISKFANGDPFYVLEYPEYNATWKDVVRWGEKAWQMIYRVTSLLQETAAVNKEIRVGDTVMLKCGKNKLYVLAVRSESYGTVADLILEKTDGTIGWVRDTPIEALKKVKE